MKIILLSLIVFMMGQGRGVAEETIRQCCRHEVLAQYAAAMDCHGYNGEAELEAAELWQMRRRGAAKNHIAVRVQIKGEWFWVEQTSVRFKLVKTIPQNASDMELFRTISFADAVKLSLGDIGQ
ncbi:MAG: hypothetical protein GY869_21005 [Planctomycetes bacterium]|nr:hypothetical protein [Planctomycetota bacterium]